MYVDTYPECLNIFMCGEMNYDNITRNFEGFYYYAACISLSAYFEFFDPILIAQCLGWWKSSDVNQ